MFTKKLPRCVPGCAGGCGRESVDAHLRKFVKKKMKPVTLIEMIDAGHLTAYVDSPFKQRSGMMLVGQPETLRTTCIELALEEHPGAVLMSDVNMNSLTALKDDFTSGRYSTIGFLDYQKLYERHSSTASNIEGTLRQLMEEGFTKGSHEDPSMHATRARAFVVAAVVERFFAVHHRAWRESGFLRRWLICLFSMSTVSRNKLVNSVHEWKKLEFDGIRRLTPTTPIPYSLTEDESKMLQRMVREQPSQATPYVLLKKIYVVLKWKYKKDQDRVTEIIKDFAPCLTKDGAQLVL
jgi:hypothetical protein